MTVGLTDLQEVSLDETTRRQRLATDPKASAWVSANAGSGKTYVLARRVVRLLLAGANPSAILCLTFTKAAAAEMSGRIYALLSSWVMASDAELSQEIANVEGEMPNAEKVRRARTLFARALETPGGLKIQTLHAFCERILHQFPLEAGVPAGFDVLDDASAADLLRQAEAATLTAAFADPSTPLGLSFQTLIESVGDFTREAAIREGIGQRALLEAVLTEHGGSLEKLADELATFFKVTLDQTEQGLLQAVPFQGRWSEAAARQLAGDLSGGSTTEQATATRIQSALSAHVNTSSEAFSSYTEIFLTKSGTPRSDRAFASKDFLKDHPELIAIREAEVARILQALQERAALRTAQLTLALMTFTLDILQRYQREKTVRSVLDFSDLISSTARLLNHGPSALWVQFKLDGGIDHILIDEAQDTGPAPWSIVKALSSEFFSGFGARSVDRTVFAVGDVKQSIYSFQGADPEGFIRQRTRFGVEAEGAGAPWNPIELQLSFRSTSDVLSAVDRVFESDAMQEAVAHGDYAPHTAIRHADPGRVYVWPMMLTLPQEAPEDWTAPVDQVTHQSPQARLAEKIAGEVRHWLHAQTRLEGTGQIIRAGDILVLVRKRDAFVETLMRTLKAQNIPVAGADRVALSDHIAVKDLIALGEVALLPHHDLPLAALLRGPLFGVTEDDLFQIAHNRGAKTLREALRQAAADKENFAELERRLASWIGRADTAPPFEFFSRVLGPDGGRALFRQRLGVEADDILDEFLALTLAYEQSSQAPTLQGFLHYFEDAAGVIKREAEAEANEVRIMTVHGAKGLEAPIVFLVDTGSEPTSRQHMPHLRTYERGEGRSPGVFWAQPKPYVTEAQDHSDQFERAKRDAEYYRLLYVGMTRARDRLYVCGYAGKKGPHAACWHRLVDDALRPQCEVITDSLDEEIALLWQLPRKQDLHLSVDPPLQSHAEPDVFVEPSWLFERPPPPAYPLAMTPSGEVGGAAEMDDSASHAVTGEPTSPETCQETSQDADARRRAIERGRYIHALLQHLPGWQRADQDRRQHQLAERYGELGEALLASGYAEARAVLDHPDFQVIFGPESRAEIDIAGELIDAEGRVVRLTGRIDRLAIDGTMLMLVDFKTGRRPTDTGARSDYARQLALYSLILRGRFPKHHIKAALLWTGEPALQEVSADELAAFAVDYRLK